MADESVINGDFSDDRTVEISGDETSSKISGLTEKIAGLEQQNEKIVSENTEHKKKIEELTASIKDLDGKNVELKEQAENAESENKTLRTVAARAAELEGDVARLQHDLVSTMTDLQESNLELSETKKALEEKKAREREDDLKLAAMEAIKKERDLLMVKVNELGENNSNLRNEMEGKEKEIQGLKKKVEELEALVGMKAGLEKSKTALEKKVQEMEGKLGHLQSKLDEEVNLKENLIAEGVNGDINRDIMVGEESKGSIGCLKGRDWAVMVGSAVGAASVLGIACYLRHASRKQ